MTTFMGIHISSGKRAYTYAAIGSDLKLLAIGQGQVEEALFFAAGQSQAVAAVCGPTRPGTGEPFPPLAASPDAGELPEFPIPATPEESEPVPARRPGRQPGRRPEMRLAEHQLRAQGIRVPTTPGQEEDCTAWHRRSFLLHRRLVELGYTPYPQPDAPRLVLETIPEAAFHCLLGLAPFPAGTLESRLQRQLVLYEAGLPVSDPLRFFEEVTRHKLLTGILPVKDIFTATELDALIAAYIAHLAAAQPGLLQCFGRPSEGLVYLPFSKA